MKIRIPLFVSVLLVLGMLAASTRAWIALPADILLPVHWNVSGHVDGYAHKPFALLLMPAVAVLMSVLLTVIPYLEPRRLNLAGSAKFYGAAWMGLVAVLAVTHGAIVAAALHVAVNMAAVVTASGSVLFIVIGNYIGKSRSNFFAGVRTPWTLSSEYAWEHANRLAGKLFTMSGAVSLAALLVVVPRLAFLVMLGLTLASAAVAVVMSYVYWRRDPDRQVGAQP